jgi:hypothetical protein
LNSYFRNPIIDSYAEEEGPVAGALASVQDGPKYDSNGDYDKASNQPRAGDSSPAASRLSGRPLVVVGDTLFSGTLPGRRRFAALAQPGIQFVNGGENGVTRTSGYPVYWEGAGLFPPFDTTLRGL